MFSSHLVKIKYSIKDEKMVCRVRFRKDLISKSET